MQSVNSEDDDDISSKYCCISVCKNYKDPDAGVDLYPLPKTEFERDLWCKVFSIPSDVARHPSSRVCGSHFRYKYFLKDDNKPAIPKPIPPAIFLDENGRKVIAIVQNQTTPVPKQLALQSSQIPPGTAIRNVPHPLNVQNISFSNDTYLNKAPGALLNPSQLMLECEEEDLSPAQLSVHNSNWKAFKEKLQKDLALDTGPNISLTTGVTNSTSNVIQVQGNPNGNLLAPTLTPSSSSTPQLVHIPSASQSVARPVNSLPTQFVQVQSQNSTLGGLSSVSKLPFRIVQVQSKNSSATNFQIVNTSNSAFHPQLIQVPFSLQGTSNQIISNSQFTTQNAVLSKPNNLSSSPIFYINSQDIVASAPLAISSSNANTISVSSTMASSNNTSVSSLPSVLLSSTITSSNGTANSSTSDVSKANAFPIHLQKVDQLVEKSSETKELSGENIFPLLPKGGSKDSLTATSASSAISLDVSSSLSVPLDEDNTPDLSNVAAVYGDELPLEMGEQKKNGNSDDKNMLSSLCSGASILRKYFESKKVNDTPISSSQNATLGPVIVDVVSANEGGLKHYSHDNGNQSSATNTEKITELSNGKTETPLNHSIRNPAAIIFKTSAGSNIKTTPNTSEMQLITKVMHPHSIFSLQKSIPVIPVSTTGHHSTRSLFTIKTMTCKNRVEDADALRERLRAENFVVTSAWWLIQKHYAPLTSACPLCGGSYFSVNRNKKFFDGFCWTCENKDCGSQEPIKRPNFFRKFQFCSLEDLLLLTYHWACQSDLDVILQDVKLDVEKIFSYFSELQEICRDAVEKKVKLGSVPGAQVEVSVVKLGNHFVLGAYERTNRNIRLEAININEAFGSPKHLEILEKWLNKSTTVISETKISDEFLPGVTKITSDPTLTDTKYKGPHTINVSRYLVRNMISLFGKVQIQALSQKVIQGYLNELQWREKFGKYNDTAFWSIFDHISSMNDPQEEDVQVVPGDLDVHGFVYMSKRFMERWGAFTQQAAYVNSVNNSIKYQLSVSEAGYSKELSTFGKYRFDTKSASLNELMKSKFWLQGSLNMLFQDLPEVPGGESNVNSKSFLNIKIQFAETPEEIEAYESDAESLGFRLSAEGYKDSPVRWLVKKGYIKSSAPCYVCNNRSYLRNNPKFVDGCSWCCQNKSCKFENIFKRPQFYARFPMLSMNHMSAIIYHWAVQSESFIIAADVPMDLVKLYHVWRSFQVLCSTSLRKKKVRLGGENEIVEVALVQYGKLYVLGAMERKTKQTLLRTFPVELKQQVPVFFRMLSQWIIPKSIVVINATLYFQMPEDYIVKIADSSIIDIDDTGYHVLNVTSYLLKQISRMFGHLKADDVRVEVLQTFLDELMWRERFGRLPKDAFYNILNDIFNLEAKDGGNSLANPPPISNGEPQSESNQESSNEQEEFLFDKLGVPDEKSASQKKDPEKKKPVTIDPASLPKVRVVLERLSESVLRYYNCLPQKPTETAPTNVQKTVKPLIISKKNMKSQNSKIYFEPHVSSQVNTSTRYTYSKSKPIVAKRNSNTSPKKRNVVFSDEEDIEIEALDEDSSTSDESNVESHSENSRSSKQKQTLPPVKRDLYFGPHLAPRVSASNQRTYSRSKSGLRKRNSGQSHKRRKIKIEESEDEVELLDQDSLDSLLSSSESHQESLAGSVECIPSVTTRDRKQKRTSLNQDSLDGLLSSSESHKESLSENIEIIPSVSTRIKKEKKTRDRPTETKENGELMCVECGSPASLDHFSKEFSCMDCKTKLYTTCCCNSFMFHRGVLLFGKRKPRKTKETYGLHKLIPLKDWYYCSCGFHSNLGNKLATHMVKCKKSTCYYQADIS